MVQEHVQQALRSIRALADSEAPIQELRLALDLLSNEVATQRELLDQAEIIQNTEQTATAVSAVELFGADPDMQTVKEQRSDPEFLIKDINDEPITELNFQANAE
jgi:hypothetical protein